MEKKEELNKKAREKSEAISKLYGKSQLATAKSHITYLVLKKQLPLQYNFKVEVFLNNGEKLSLTYLFSFLITYVLY